MHLMDEIQPVQNSRMFHKSATLVVFEDKV